jgi:hypothetical protein
MHGWHPKVPLNTVEISRMTQDQVAEWEREHKETTAMDNLRYLSSSGDLTSSSGDLGLTQRQGQIELAEKTRTQAGANIQANPEASGHGLQPPLRHPRDRPSSQTLQFVQTRRLHPHPRFKSQQRPIARGESRKQQTLGALPSRRHQPH